MSNETSPSALAGGSGPKPHGAHDGPGPGRSTLRGQNFEPADGVVSKETRRRVVAASFIGNFVEWFDYAVYGYLAVTIAAVFFPESDPQTGLLLTFALFAISFLVRPLGGFVWGHIGDRVGRRTALSLSILIM
ncbi:MFS transporter, partial [Pseudarthrobacter sp. AB1]|uniref:MFS transporter n=1 Tax=Pseudarthrobacter sp. AB1 TaxID=2138309 RepID=UPI00186B64A9